MSEKLAFGLLLIRVQGGVEDRLKVGGGGGGCVVVSLGHGSCWEGEMRRVNGKEREHCRLVFRPTDGDRYGTTRAC
jgi:hypothetical protein